jgi:hypothetical protein
MSSAIEVLKKYSTSCSVCKYDGGNQCKASGGEFGECKPAEEFYDAIQTAVLALEKRENYVIDYIRLEVLPKTKKKQFRVFFRDGTEQVFEQERVGEQK